MDEMELEFDYEWQPEDEPINETLIALTEQLLQVLKDYEIALRSRNIQNGDEIQLLQNLHDKLTNCEHCEFKSCLRNEFESHLNSQHPIFKPEVKEEVFYPECELNEGEINI